MVTGAATVLKLSIVYNLHHVLRLSAKVDHQHFRAQVGETQKPYFPSFFFFFLLGGGLQRCKEDWLMSKNQAFQVLVMTPTRRSFGRSYFSLKLRFKLVLGANILIRLSCSSLLAILLSSHPLQTQTVRVGGEISLY